jgi:nifR3 family TIM-barrel protein
VNNNFWQELNKKTKAENRPIFALAPMADVTDCAFRALIAKYSRSGELGGGPDVFWTEFVSADGLMSGGREVLKRDLVFSDKEHPIVAQIFTSNPENMRGAAALCRELGFDGVDINMGCPDKSIEKQGAGACMIKTPENARAVIRAAIDGAGSLPVSVKTRIGYNKIEWREWLGEILKEDIKALTVHFRTRKEMSLVEAHWELAKEIVDYVHELRPDVVVLGNGDIKSLSDGQNKFQETGVDGVMIGRGVFGTPWFFDRARDTDPTLKERFKILVEHTYEYEKTLGDIKSFAVMKKHYKAYVNGFNGAKELREVMMNANTAQEIEAIVERFMHENPSMLE